MSVYSDALLRQIEKLADILVRKWAEDGAELSPFAAKLMRVNEFECVLAFEDVDSLVVSGILPDELRGVRKELVIRMLRDIPAELTARYTKVLSDTLCDLIETRVLAAALVSTPYLELPPPAQRKAQEVCKEVQLTYVEARRDAEARDVTTQA